MPFDAFTLKHTVKELNSLFKGAKINKVNEPSKEEIVLSVYNQGKNNKILISFYNIFWHFLWKSIFYVV